MLVSTGSKSSKKKKEVSAEDRDKIVGDLHAKVQNAFANCVGVKFSPALSGLITKRIQSNLVNTSAQIKDSSSVLVSCFTWMITLFSSWEG